MTTTETGTTPTYRLTVTYRTEGGNFVTWKKGYGDEADRWECGGCAESDTGGKGRADSHAASCHAESYTNS